MSQPCFMAPIPDRALIRTYVHTTKPVTYLFRSLSAELTSTVYSGEPLVDNVTQQLDLILNNNNSQYSYVLSCNK